jgi:hypothetical protein
VTRAALAVLAACSSASSEAVVSQPASDAAVSIDAGVTIDAVIIPDPIARSPHQLNTELEKQLRATGAVHHHVVGHVTVLEDDKPLLQLSRQRAMPVVATVSHLLLDPLRDVPRCFSRGLGVLCSQSWRGNPAADRRILFLMYCRTDSWRLHTIMIGFSGSRARELLRDGEQGACP